MSRRAAPANSYSNLHQGTTSADDNASIAKGRRTEKERGKGLLRAAGRHNKKLVARATMIIGRRQFQTRLRSTVSRRADAGEKGRNYGVIETSKWLKRERHTVQPTGAEEGRGRVNGATVRGKISMETGDHIAKSQC